MMPHRTPFFLPLLYPELYWRIPTNDKRLFLTFDDGPVPGPTEFVLDTLGRYSLKATFFCIGDNIKKNPNLFTRLLKDGHAAGNHTYHHLSGWKTCCRHYLEDIALCDSALDSTSNAFRKQGKHFFRPPYGRITRKQISSLRGRAIIMWDVLSVDYNRRLSAESCLRNTVRAIRPGSIVVFHDSYKAEKNLTYVLPRMIESCMGLGYSFRPITL
jgi:peptidoglycan-N-acetylglucosamine deacetylase